jgi:hypothetical protein
MWQPAWLIIIGVARHGLGRGIRHRSQLDRQVDEKLLDSSPALRLEAELAGEDPLQLHHHRLRQDELQATVDRLLDHPARRAGRDEGGDQDVCVACDHVPVALGRYPWIVKHSVLSTTPTAEKPVLSDEQRAERLRLLAERLRRPDGLDRDTLEHIEQLTGTER